MIDVAMVYNHWEYYDGTWHEIVKAREDKWYHVRIDFECGSGGYQGLSADTFKVYIDNVSYGAYSFYTAVGSVDNMRILTDDADSGYSIYVDAIGYSWDGSYSVGDNHKDKTSGTPFKAGLK